MSTQGAAPGNYRSCSIWCDLHPHTILQRSRIHSELWFSKCMEDYFCELADFNRSNRIRRVKNFGSNLANRPVYGGKTREDWHIYTFNRRLPSIGGISVGAAVASEPFLAAILSTNSIIYIPKYLYWMWYYNDSTLQWFKVLRFFSQYAEIWLWLENYSDFRLWLWLWKMPVVCLPTQSVRK